MRNKKINVQSIEQNNSKNAMNKREQLPLKDKKENKINSKKPENKSEIKKDANNNQSSEKSNFWDKTKNFFKDIWADKLKRYITIGIVSALLITVIVVPIAVTATKKDSDSDSDSKNDSETESEPKYECSEPDYITPDCTGVCPNPYDIQVYSDCILKKKLINECKYKEGAELTNFVLEAIKRHNILRACHNAQPMMFNCEILKISQDYAEKMPSGHSGTTFHDKWMGENLFWSTGMSLTGDYPVNRWYNEIVDYNFETGASSNGNAVGHFTQVVWKDSNELGIGYYCKERSCCVVGNYFPGGNFNNNYLTQVQKMQEQSLNSQIASIELYI